ncbi:MAG: sigma-E processing peptidase SpoIIGA [Oscillospiraceae bacterium]|nr:sigma-E processing peptidase SpoIIGA [Oscillospiraceae bacterium]
MQTIYLDVLLVCQLYVHYILLRITAGMTHSRLRTGRCLLGAACGSLSTLMIFLPPLPTVLSVLCKLLCAVLLCALTFGWHDPRRLLWNSISLFGSSFALAGILLALSLCSGIRVVEANACWYLDVSLLHLVLFTIVAYLLLRTVQHLRDRSHAAEGGYRICIRYRSCTAQLEGLADTGNVLTDYFTGCPVIVCDRALLGAMLPADDTCPQGCRLLPYTTVSGSSLLPVFRPDEVVIRSERDGRTRCVDALIGAGTSPTKKAIFHPRLLES